MSGSLSAEARPLLIADVVGDVVDAKRLYDWLDSRPVCNREGQPTEMILHVEATEQEPGVWTPLDLTEDV